ncbi:MAG: prephenate dehydrogenase/arogenate dehydrogenase family protein [Acidimicrobiia bacterium]|nr:prephenate dehydrogenase/arogenate dehydrogenase family protein [Acidimicrobiia bacterium]
MGTGLVGGSIGLGLRAQGWHVSGTDRSEERAQRAVEVGAVDAVGEDPRADITFVATPVRAVPEQVRRALEVTDGLVTDVGSVKSPMLSLMADPRYVGGHPMAGSEREGVEGARPDLFEGAVWVLTPVAGTDDSAFAAIRSVITTLGAEVVALPPDRHDQMVALVSHVPHLTAAVLMDLADRRAVEHGSLMRLAAGGFRDMTRIASGDPAIWPDICAENAEAIVGELDELIRSLEEVRAVVAERDGTELVERLDRARRARTNLPVRIAHPEDVAEVRVPIADEAGAAAKVFLLASELDVSIADVEIMHSAEGSSGVLVLLVEAEAALRLQEALVDRGQRCSVQRLS